MVESEEETVMNEDIEEKLVTAFERIATALEGLNESTRRAGTRYWPEPREQRETKLTRVESEEERERKNQGARRRTIQEIVDPDIEEDDDEYIGERTRQYLRDHAKERQISPASPEIVGPTEEVGTSTEEVEGKA
jgi:hypothetical protein